MELAVNKDAETIDADNINFGVDEKKHTDINKMFHKYKKSGQAVLPT